MKGNILALMLLIGSFAGCSSMAAVPDRANSNVLTLSEIQATSSANLLDAVERLRPLWLRSGPQRSANLPTEVVVVVNGMYFGDIESLRSISTDAVSRLRYMDAASATASYSGLDSNRHVAGAILVEFVP